MAEAYVQAQPIPVARTGGGLGMESTGSFLTLSVLVVAVTYTLSAFVTGLWQDGLGQGPTVPGTVLLFTCLAATVLAVTVYAIGGRWRSGSDGTSGGPTPDGPPGERRGREPDPAAIVILLLVLAVTDLTVTFATIYQAYSRPGDILSIPAAPLGQLKALYYSVGTLSTASAPSTGRGLLEFSVIAQEVLDFSFVTFVASIAINRLSARR